MSDVALDNRANLDQAPTSLDTLAALPAPVEAATLPISADFRYAQKAMNQGSFSWFNDPSELADAMALPFRL